MRLSRTRRFVANMGNYGERYEAGVTVTLDPSDLGYTDEEWASKAAAADDPHYLLDEFNEVADEMLDRVLQPEIDFVHDHRDPEEDTFLPSRSRRNRPVRRRRRN